MEQKKYVLNQDCVIDYGQSTARYVKGTKATLSDQSIYRSYEKFYQVDGCEVLFPENLVEEYKEPLLSDIVKFSDIVIKDDVEFVFCGHPRRDTIPEYRTVYLHNPLVGMTERWTTKQFNRAFKLKNK